MPYARVPSSEIENVSTPAYAPVSIRSAMGCGSPVNASVFTLNGCAEMLAIIASLITVYSIIFKPFYFR